MERDAPLLEGGGPLLGKVKVAVGALIGLSLAVLAVSIAGLAESVDVNKKVSDLQNAQPPVPAQTPNPTASGVLEASPSASAPVTEAASGFSATPGDVPSAEASDFPSAAASDLPSPPPSVLPPTPSVLPPTPSVSSPTATATAVPSSLPWPLPASYAVPDAYILPATDQDGLGTCWAFATIYLFESQYHAQGVERGFLVDNATHSEYVKLSVQAYFSLMRERCLSNWTAACNYGGVLAGNSSEDQEIESVYYFNKAWPGFGQQLLPEAVCPYKTYSGQPDFDYFDCPALDFALQPGQNPISWKIKSITMAYETEKIKELLLSKGRALGIGTPLSDIVYYVPCEGGVFNATDDCVNEVYPCPDGSGYCTKLVVDGRHQDGVFLAQTDPKYMGELGGHGMDIVGYNDEWLFHERFQSVSGGDVPVPLKGTFILHNSWTAQRGHSVQYLLGNQSQENEDWLCPNRLSPDNWIPVSQQCLESQAGMASLKADWGNPDGPKINCSEVGESTIRRIRGKRGVWQWPDVLVCSRPGYCDRNESVFYFLAKASPKSGDANVKYLSSGLHEVNLIRVNISSEEVTPVKLSKLPFWALSSILHPVDTNSSSSQNDADNCGFWALPYEALENMRRLNWDLLDNFRVVDLEIEFDNQSYLLGGADQFNTTLLQASTKFLAKPQLDGPIPFDKIYTTPVARPYRRTRRA